ANLLRFVPDANENGNPYATIGFQVSDGTDFSAATYTLTVNVTAVNDAPTSTDDSITTLEDNTVFLAAGDFGTYADIESTPLAAVKITSTPTDGVLQHFVGGVWTTVVANDVISRADIDANLLRFVPDANENGNPYATIGFQVSDGTDFSAATYTLTVNVTAVNDAPTSTDDSITTLEDNTVFLAAGDFGTYADIESTPLAAVKITSTPTDGVLQHFVGGVWTTVVANDVISRADIDANLLRFVPDANENGNPYATIGFQVSDGTAFSAATYTLTVNVTAVNDAPTSTDDSITTLEDNTVFLAAGDFGTYADIESTPLAAVKITSTPTDGVLQHFVGGVWTTVVANDVISRADIDANLLRFVPDANENGNPYTTIGFQV